MPFEPFIALVLLAIGLSLLVALLAIQLRQARRDIRERFGGDLGRLG